MPRLTLHTLDTAPAASQPFVKRAIDNNGFLPNLVAALANSPVAIETYFTVAAINARASLTLGEREVVQIIAARVHGCDFCVAGHSAVALKKAGFSEAAVQALHEGRVTGDARADALASFVRAIIASRGDVSDAELEAFVAAGFERAAALEVVLGVSLATLCNFANNLARNEINPELQPFRPGAVRAAGF
jgi:uncharacterized peroxidase-related enzyme